MTPSATPAELDFHFKPLIQGMLGGRVTPFLGAGVNLCSRPDGYQYLAGQADYLPSGFELAEHLRSTLGAPESAAGDLVRTAQFAALIAGEAALYDELHKLFDANYPSTAAHRLLARIPALFRGKNYPPQHMVHITTNYDDVLERAFRDAGELFDVLVYITDGDDRGKFVHLPCEGGARLIERPNEYSDVNPATRSVILKIHGAVDRSGKNEDSFVITEDHYIDYLTRTDIASLLPVHVAARLKKSHFLFLGYGLRDWNLRVILHRIAGAQKLPYSSWAIQRGPDHLDTKFWSRREITIIDCDLSEYIAALAARLDGLPSK